MVVILCLARRGKKSLSYPELDRELVKETMGGTDLEGFGEKDVTHFDLKFLQVTPDGFLVGGEWQRTAVGKGMIELWALAEGVWKDILQIVQET